MTPRTKFSTVLQFVWFCAMCQPQNGFGDQSTSASRFAAIKAASASTNSNGPIAMAYLRLKESNFNKANLVKGASCHAYRPLVSCRCPRFATLPSNRPLLLSAGTHVLGRRPPPAEFNTIILVLCQSK